jgi:hypothetical protein
MMRQEKDRRVKRMRMRTRMMYESRTEKRIGEAAQRATLNKLGPGLVVTQTTGTL